MPVTHSSKFQIAGLNDTNQQYTGKKKSLIISLHLIKKKLKGEDTQTAVFLLKFFPSIPEPTLALASKAKSMPFPILSKVH